MDYTLVTTPYVEKHLVATDSNDRFEWFTGWYLATGVDTIRAAIKMNAVSGLQTALAIQTATNRTDAAGNPSLLTVYISASSSTDDVTVSSYTNGNQWFRLGVAYSSSASPPAIGQADIGLEGSWAQMGSLLDTRVNELSSDSADAKVSVISRWFPQRFASKLRVAFEINSLEGSGAPLYQLALQTAPFTGALPGSWDTSIDPTAHSITGSSESNTGDLPITMNSDMWIRVGLFYSLATAGPETNVVITTTVSIRTG